jgi:hypothetical protein
MTDLIVVPQAAHWQRLKRLVLDSVSSPITRRVYNLGLDEFFEPKRPAAMLPKKINRAQYSGISTSEDYKPVMQRWSHRVSPTGLAQTLQAGLLSQAARLERDSHGLPARTAGYPARSGPRRQKLNRPMVTPSRSCTTARPRKILPSSC